MEKISDRLFGLQDLKYKDFQSRLMPTVETDKIIGVRIPELRKYAKELYGSGMAEAFLNELPHRYYEENNLHGLLIERRTDYSLCIAELDRFLPYVDNWATCDLISPKIFKKHLTELVEEIKRWIASEHTYMIRFGIKILMQFYLNDEFHPKYLEMIACIRSDEYYINMMIAWYFATALTKQYDEALPYILERKLDPWTHNKTIQKAMESYRITEEQKSYLKSLKIRKE